jgi:hypothetical protein
MFQRLGGGRGAAFALRDWGIALHVLGDLEGASSKLEAARKLAREVSDPRLEGSVFAHLSVVRARTGDPTGALEALRSAKELLDRARDPGLSIALLLLQDLVNELLGGTADRPLAPEELEEASKRHFSVRMAERVASRADRPRKKQSKPTSPARSNDPVLELSVDGRWVKPPNAEPIELTRRRSLRLILLALVERHERAPDEALSQDDVLAAGWPGERVTAEAAQNRVHTAIYSLRKLGLDDWLVRRDDGYLLRSPLAIERRNAAADAQE